MTSADAMFGSPDALRVVVRTVHFASSIGLFGEFVFFLLVGRDRARQAALAASGAATWRRLRFVASIWLAVVVVSGAVWLQLEAAVMSGLPASDVLDGDVLGVVLTQTLFGRVWSIRLVLALALGIALALPGRSAVGGRRTVLLCAAMAAAMLASLALAGHANAEDGVDRVVHRTVDAMHLLAAGAWLGALLPLAAALSTARPDQPIDTVNAAAYAARRFSSLGIVCVATLAGTGFVNASYTVGRLSSLVDTTYGRLLSVKLCLFVVMLVLATMNRSRWMATLATNAVDVADRVAAARRLRTNVAIEVAVGLAIVGVVGVLGITMPAMRSG